MTTIDTSRDTRPFDPEELARIHENRSTERLMNDAARSAHVLARDVTLGTHDATRRELHEEHLGLAPSREKAGEMTEMGLHATEVLEAGAELPAVGLPLSLVSPAVSLVLGFDSAIVKPAEEGTEENAAIKREQLHVALTATLELPDGFKSAELAKHPEIARGFQSDVLKICEAIRDDKGARAALQLNCDKGMNAAVLMLGGSLDRGKFFAVHPEVGEKYIQDPAFRAGFDAMIWAKEHDQLAPACRALFARDARYDANHIACRA